MKECPNCKKEFAEDLFYCLFDGTPLTTPSHGFDPAAKTEMAFEPVRSEPTLVLERPSPVPPTPSSKIPYVIIGALLIVCVILAGAFVVTNLDRLTGSDQKIANTDKVSVQTSTPTPAGTNVNRETVNIPVSSSSPKPPAVELDPTGKWRGQWSTPSGTMLDIEITLADTRNSGVDGQIKWTMRKTVRPDKMDKIGLSATEFVRGTFDPATRSLTMSGYSKDDPNDVLVMVDDYRLTVSADGKTLSGKARNGGKWNGYLRLNR
jgi:hypothetical protein